MSKDLMQVKHPGFQAVQGQIASEKSPSGKPYGMKVAGAILAKRSRMASKKSKKKNPRLKKVLGAPKY